jgi:phosphatidylinositol-3-phosphatase
MRLRRMGIAVLAGTLPLLLSVIGTTTARANPRRVPAFGRVYVIIGENTELGQINKSDAPYMTGLKSTSQVAWLTHYYALTHFSEANYVGMTSGQFTSCQQFDGSAASCHQDATQTGNLFSQLDSAGITWQSWMESMPAPCYLTSTGSAKNQDHYGAKHNPAIFFDAVEGAGGVWSATDQSAECLANDIPAGTTAPKDMSAFETALRNGTTARFNFVVPNECEDGHDNCKPQGNGVEQFDSFLSREIPQITANDPSALIIVTFDEGTSNQGLGHGHQFQGGGNVAWFAMGSQVVPGVYGANYDHYSFLRTLEDGFGLPYLGGAATASSIEGIWS